MIVTRTPLRVTLGGGGSDLGPGGYCIAAAIDKYVTIAVTETFDDCYALRYSRNERVARPDQIEHRLFRTVLERLKIGPGVEISSTADIPAGTGLGSSGAFTVGLLHALLRDPSRPELARLACELDVGKQDQHAAVYGGVNAFDFEKGTLRPIETTVDRHMALYWTGRKREARKVLTGEKLDVQLARWHAEDSVDALIRNDIKQLGASLLQQWVTKWLRQPSKFHEECNRIINAAMDRGATGGKLVGAGGGGFILVAADNLEVAAYMKEAGLRRVPFRFDHQGTTVLAA